MTHELASDWLTRGIAAARAHERDEARFMLEHALIELDVMAESYGQIDDQAREDAWYWLSTITDDPKQKRDYLESVLASNPAYPEARRDLAILDGRLKPGDVLGSNASISPLVPDARAPTADVRRYTCPRCGGKLSYDAPQQALVCEYCGYHAAESASGLIPEQEFVSTLYTARAQLWQLPTARLLACQSCGAHFTLPPSQASGNCPFCGSAHIVASSAHGELIEPGGIIPFQFEQDRASLRVRQWLAAGHGSKDDLKHISIARPRPVYFPFWTFTMGGEVKWHGLVEEVRSSDGRLVWLERSGSDVVLLDNLLVPASHSLPNELTRAMGAQAAEDDRTGADTPPRAGYALAALLPYADTYLANWPVEIYQIPLASASLVARQRTFELGKERVRGTVTAHELTFDSTGIIIDSYKLVLLPLWVCEVTVKTETTLLAVNGQTGAIQGHLPQTGLRKFIADLLGS